MTEPRVAGKARPEPPRSVSSSIGLSGGGFSHGGAALQRMRPPGHSSEKAMRGGPSGSCGGFMLLSKLRFLLVGVVLAPPCLLPWQVQLGDDTVSAHQDDSAAASPEPTSALFDDAAAEFSVPADLLRAYAAARAQDDARDGAAALRIFGPMGLREGE